MKKYKNKIMHNLNYASKDNICKKEVKFLVNNVILMELVKVDINKWFLNLGIGGTIRIKLTYIIV